jgi:uncharacterized protein (DUF433 family)
MDVALLDREIYSEAEAARLLGLPQSTLHWWLDGGNRGGRSYPPVIRAEPTGSRTVTWAEFVEAGLLRQYRREEEVALSEIRTFISRLREKQGVPYPLAEYRPWIGESRRLLLEVQEETDLPAKWCLVATVNDQLVWTDAAASFIRRVEFDDGLAAAWKPHDDEQSPVRCRPDQRFGRPAIKGISTEAIVEQLNSGADWEEVADQFDLEVDDVRWASYYEHSQRARLAAAA